MQNQYEEPRSIRRKRKREGTQVISETESKAAKKSLIENEISEMVAAEKIAEEEAMKYNAKIEEVKEEIRNVLYNADLELEEKARRVVSLKARRENYEFIVDQANSKLARLTHKRKALEKVREEAKS